MDGLFKKKSEMCKTCKYWNKGGLINPCYECNDFDKSRLDFSKASPCKPPKKEMVDKPDHYGGTLVIEYLEALEALPGNKMNFSRTNAIKYISRAGMKFPDKEIEELEKAAWYIKREIERIKK